MLVGHDRPRDRAEHAPAEVLQDGAALICVAIRRHDRVPHQLPGDRTGHPVLLSQTLDLRMLHTPYSEPPCTSRAQKKFSAPAKLKKHVFDACSSGNSRNTHAALCV